MATTLAELLIKIDADGAGLRQEFQRIEKTGQRSANKLKRTLGRIGAAVGGVTKRLFSMRGALVGLVGAGGIGLLIKKSLDFADAIDKASGKIGVSTDLFQELRFAADQTGVAFRTFEIGLQRFSRRVGEAALDKGELNDTLKQYGIAVVDAQGQTRALEDILGDYAEAIRTANSQQEQLRLAFKAFDSEGAVMVNLLKRGREGMADLRKQARDLGIVMDGSLIASAVDAKDKWEALTAVLDVKVKSAVVSLAPEIETLVSALIDKLPEITQAVDQFARFIGLDTRSKQIENLRAQIAELNQDIGKLMGGALLSGDPSNFDALLERRKGQVAELQAQLDALLNPPARKTPDAPSGSARTTTPTTTGSKVFADATVEFIENLRIETKLLALNADEREKAVAVMAAQNAAMAQGNLLAPEQIQKIRDQIGAQQDLRQSQEAATEGQSKLNEQLRAREDFGASLERENQELALRVKFGGEESEELRTQLRLLAAKNELGEEAAHIFEGQIAANERLRTALEGVSDQTSQLDSVATDFGSPSAEACAIYGPALEGLFECPS